MARIVINKKEIMYPRPTCFCCKSSLIIYRNKVDNDVIYFDGHLYHKDCFINMNKIRKKCCYCHEDIDVTENEHKLVYYDKHYYHKDCFIEWCHATKTPTPKRTNALKNLEKYLCEGEEIILGLLNKKGINKDNIEKFSNDTNKYISQWFDESDLCSFLRDEYNIVKLPWTKIKDVINGTSKKIDVPISASELLDMWERKIDYLRSSNQKLISQSNKVITPELLVLYDLSILINKYDSYLRWKEKQKILEAEKETEKSQNIVSQSIGYTNVSKDSKADTDDISDLVDDIFG